MSEPKKRAPKTKFGHVRVSTVSLLKICPSPENKELYGPVDPDDPQIVELAESIKRVGLQEPLVVTSDGYIVSGHRRSVAAWRAGLRAVPCRRLKVSREAHPNFVGLLRECNQQRVKTRAEQLREEVVSTNPEAAHQSLVEYREESSRVCAETIELREAKTRCAISDAKKPFLDAVIAIIKRLEDFWPLSDRQIHYQLLNDPPLIHAGKQDSRYQNDVRSYKALSDLLTRARHERKIPYHVIADATRPVTLWNVCRDTAGYLADQLHSLFRGYARDLLQSQPNHIEIVAEKLTLANIIRPIGSHYCMPITIARGFCSTTPKHAIASRYRKSGKQRLVILVISDFDPDGDEIAHSFARSLRDDFRIGKIDAVKVALTQEQVEECQLPPSMMKAKRDSSNYSRFVERYGSDTIYELEALEPETLQGLLREAILSVLDVDAFNAELDAEKQDALHLDTLRKRVLHILRDSGIGDPETQNADNVLILPVSNL